MKQTQSSVSYTVPLQRDRQEKWAGELGGLWIPCVGHWCLCAFAVAFEQDRVQCCTRAPSSPHLLLPLMVGLQY